MSKDDWKKEEEWNNYLKLTEKYRKDSENYMKKRNSIEENDKSESSQNSQKSDGIYKPSNKQSYLDNYYDDIDDHYNNYLEDGISPVTTSEKEMKKPYDYEKEYVSEYKEYLKKKYGHWFENTDPVNNSVEKANKKTYDEYEWWVKNAGGKSEQKQTSGPQPEDWWKIESAKNEQSSGSKYLGQKHRSEAKETLGEVETDTSIGENSNEIKLMEIINKLKADLILSKKRRAEAEEGKYIFIEKYKKVSEHSAKNEKLIITLNKENKNLKAKLSLLEKDPEEYNRRKKIDPFDEENWEN